MSIKGYIVTDSGIKFRIYHYDRWIEFKDFFYKITIQYSLGRFFSFSFRNHEVDFTGWETDTYPSVFGRKSHGYLIEGFGLAIVLLKVLK